MRVPKRIQRRRIKGWRLPKNAVCVTRPGVFGNPFGMLPGDDPKVVVGMFERWIGRRSHLDPYADQRWALLDRLHELRGKDLACYCKPGAPCHADVLLELANKPLAKKVA